MCLLNCDEWGLQNYRSKGHKLIPFWKVVSRFKGEFFSLFGAHAWHEGWNRATRRSGRKTARTRPYPRHHRIAKGQIHAYRSREEALCRAVRGGHIMKVWIFADEITGCDWLTVTASRVFVKQLPRKKLSIKKRR